VDRQEEKAKERGRKQEKGGGFNDSFLVNIQ
jgi:hypothetical protein